MHENRIRERGNRASQEGQCRPRTRAAERRDRTHIARGVCRAEKLAAFGVAALARKVDDASQLARITGVSAATAKAVVLTGRTMSQSEKLSAALQQGDVSLDQATVIASAEESARGVAAELVEVAQTETFHVVKHKARKAKLEAEQHRDLALRQQVPVAIPTSSG